MDEKSGVNKLTEMTDESRSASLPTTTLQRSLRELLLRFVPGFLDTSLKNLLLVMLGAIFIASFLAIATGVSAVIFRTERDAWRERHTEAAHAATQTLSLFLDRARQILVNISLLDHDGSAQPARVMHFILNLEQSAGLLEVVRLDQRGEILGSASRGAPMLDDLVAVRQSDWFQNAATGEIYLGDIQVAPDGSPYLIMAIAAPDQGIVAARLDMRILWQLAADMRFGRTGRTYIVNSNGRIIAHPDPDVVLQNVSLETRPEFAAFKEAPSQEWSGSYTNFEGDNVFGVMTSLPSTGWITITEVHVSEVYRTIRLLLLVIAFGTMAVGISARLITIPMLDWLLFGPLEILRSSADRIGQGQLEQQIKLRWQNEIGQVLSAFNAMASRLRDRDDQIAARTTALASEITERQRVEEDVRRHTARAEALVRTAARFNAQLDYDTIIKMICDETRSTLASDAASVSLYDAFYDRYYNVADVGLPPSYHEVVQPVSRARAERLIAQTAEAFPSRPQDRLIIRSDVQADAEDPNHEVNIAYSIRSVISIAMTNEDEVVGRITAHFLREPRQFSMDEVESFRGLANQAAQAIRNARLFAGATRRLQRLHALHAIDQVIIEARELPETLQVVVAQVVEQLRVDAISILLYDAETEELAYAAGTGFRHEGIRQTHVRLGEGLAGRTAAERRIYHVVNLAEVDTFTRASLLADEEFVSYYGVSMVAQEQLIGVLEIFHRSVMESDPEWFAYLEALALQAAIAIEHTYLFSETRRLLQETQKQARQMEEIMDTVPEGVLCLSRDYHILLVNPAAHSYLPLLARGMRNNVLTDLGGEPVDTFLESEASDTVWKEVVVEEARRIFEVTASPLRAVSEIEGWVMVVRDVTQERQRQEAVQIQERLATVGQFAAGIAHDFNNIMAVIILYSQLLQHAPQLSAKNRQQLTTIYQQASHAGDLIQQILDFSRRSVMERHPLDLGAFLKGLVKLWQRVLPETIALRLIAEPRQYTVNVDPTRLQQALMNLVVNAKDAMTTGGTLTLRLAYENVTPEQSVPMPEMSPGGWISVSVSDSGMGIPSDVIPRIFEPFYTTKAPGKGTGLGLAQVHGIITQHDGFIKVESQLGQGTTFTLYLPPAEEEVVEGLATEQPVQAVGAGETILLVEDNDSARDAMQHGLEELAYHVLTAPDGKIALNLLRQASARVDLVLSDLVMPDMGGLDLYRIIQAEAIPVKMVLMTGYPLEEEGRQLLKQGNVTWLQKPVSLERLANTLQDVLRTH